MPKPTRYRALIDIEYYANGTLASEFENFKAHLEKYFIDRKIPKINVLEVEEAEYKEIDIEKL